MMRRRFGTPPARPPRRAKAAGGEIAGAVRLASGSVFAEKPLKGRSAFNRLVRFCWSESPLLQGQAARERGRCAILDPGQTHSGVR